MSRLQKDLTDAIAYCRVSTDKQADLGHALERYIQDFKRYGFSEEQIYYDIDSGGNNKREGYLAALEQIKLGKKRVFVPEISRFSRSVAGFEEAIATFRNYGAKLLTLDGHDFDLVTPTGITNTRLMVVFAEQARLTNQYQSTQGYKNLRAQGRPIRPIFPYLIEDKQKFIPDNSRYKESDRTCWEVAREVVETFLKLKNLNKTIAQLCDRYGTYKLKGAGCDFPRDSSGLKYWLNCQPLRGNIEYFGAQRYKYQKDAPKPILVCNTHEPLIDTHEDHCIKAILEFNKTARCGTNKIVNPFINLAYCVCGQKMKKSYSHPTGYAPVNYLVCKAAYPYSARDRQRQKDGILPTCDRRSSYGLTLDKLEQIVISRLQQRIESVADLYFPRLGVLENPELAKIEADIVKLSGLVDDMPDLESVLAKKLRERDVLLFQNKIEGQQQQNILRQKLIEYAKDDNFWAIATVAEKQVLFSELIDRIVCDRGEVTITYHF